MAIFFFRLRSFANLPKCGLVVVVFPYLLFSGHLARGAGYVISSKDRAEATALSQQAYVTFQAGDYEQALGLLTQSDRLKPDQPDGWNLRGVIYLKEKAYDQAQSSFARAVALDPDLWAARFNLSEVFFQRKDFARARASFEHLLSQTDRFKEKNKWELVQYKTIVCSVLLGDDRGAGKQLARLPATGGSTPAYLYAQAALAFRAKNAAQAQKSIGTAQSSFPAAINDLFSDSLVQAGWEAPLPSMAALAANVPPLPPGNRAPLVIDPQLQADSAGPLPVGDAPSRPIVSTINPALHHSSDARPKNRPPVPAETAFVAAVPQVTVGTDLENGGLLLDE